MFLGLLLKKFKTKKIIKASFTINLRHTEWLTCYTEETLPQYFSHATPGLKPHSHLTSKWIIYTFLGFNLKI